MRNLLVILLLLIVGCSTTNSYQKHYQSFTNVDKIDREEVTSPKPIFINAKDYNDPIIREYVKKGYVMFGYASFIWSGRTFHNWMKNKKSGQHPQLVAWADSVDADLVIYGVTKGELKTHQKVVTTPVTENVEVEVKDNDYLTNDKTTVTGKSTTYKTNVVTQQTQEYIIFSQYYVKKKFTLGISVEFIPEDLRPKFQRNTGAYVSLVIDESPAFIGNIMEGDVIISINDKLINSPNQLTEIIDMYISQKVEIQILRLNDTTDLVEKITLEINL